MQHEGAVRSAVFSKNGEQLLTASADYAARIWNTRTGTKLVVLKGHRGAVTMATFSPQGDRVVTASDDGTAIVWDARTGSRGAVLQHGGGVNSAAFNSDGTSVVTVSADKTIRIWEILPPGISLLSQASETLRCVFPSRPAGCNRRSMSRTDRSRFAASFPEPDEQPHAAYAAVWTGPGIREASR